MTDEEKAAQRALGTEKIFIVTVEIPIIGAIKVRKEVMATSEEDAIERIKQIESMSTPHQLQQELFENGTSPGYGYQRNIVRDPNKSKEYCARVMQDNPPGGALTGSGAGF
jgi:G:T/U-mismatch repair DNA glycosylase